MPAAEEIVFPEGSDANIVAEFAQALSEFQEVAFEVRACNALIKQDRCPSGRAERARVAISSASERVINAFAEMVEQCDGEADEEDEA